MYPAQEQVKKDSIRDQNDPRLEEFRQKRSMQKNFYGGVLTDISEPLMIS